MPNRSKADANFDPICIPLHLFFTVLAISLKLMLFEESMHDLGLDPELLMPD